MENKKLSSWIRLTTLYISMNVWKVNGVEQTLDIEADCKDCVKNSTSVYLKRLWFPLAPADYTCINLNESLSKHSIIVEAVCELGMCKGINSRKPKHILDPTEQFCLNKSVNVTKVDLNIDYINPTGDVEETVSTWPQTLKLCVHIGEGLFVLFVIVAYLVKSREQASQTLRSLYHRFVNIFQVKIDR